MKVILLRNVASLGKKGEVKNVSDGYARNFLIPKKYARYADIVSLHTSDQQAAARHRAEEHQKGVVDSVVHRLSNMTLHTTLSVGKDGSVFGAIGIPHILALLANEGIHLDKSTISLDRSLKTLGTHPIKITVSQGKTAVVSLLIKGQVS